MEKQRKIAMVVNRVRMDEYDQSYDDMEYWLSKTPQERGAAVTFLVNQVLKPGQRMDRTVYNQIVLTK